MPCIVLGSLMELSETLHGWGSDFYGDNDMDMQMTHPTVWALMESPLLNGTDLRDRQ